MARYSKDPFGMDKKANKALNSFGKGLNGFLKALTKPTGKPKRKKSKLF